MDNLIGIKSAISNWIKHFSTDNKQPNLDFILEKYGVWSCLLGGVLASKVAQYEIFTIYHIYFNKINYNF